MKKVLSFLRGRLYCSPPSCKCIYPLPLILFLFGGSFLDLSAQVTPGDIAGTISYELETKTLYGLPASLEPEELGPFQLAKYQRRFSTKQISTELYHSGQFLTEINFLSTENAQPEWMTPIGKIVIDSLGTTVYDQAGEEREYVAHSEKYQQYNDLLGLLSLANPQRMGLFPYEGNLDAAKINNYEERGYEVEIVSSSRYRLLATGQVITVDPTIGFYEIRRYDEAEVLQYYEQNIFQPNTNNQWVPYFTLRREYQTDALGYCSSNIDILRYSNFQIDSTPPQYRKTDKKEALAPIHIYPNPTKGLLTLQFSESNKTDTNWNVEVFDLRGKKVATFNFEATETYSFDTAALAKGLYLLRADNGKIQWSHKLSKL